MPRTPGHTRFWKFVVKTDGCWHWTGAKNQSGYGIFWDNRYWTAHRWSYRVAKGEIPKGFQLDHLCRNTSCVNPDHLEPVTHIVNYRRGMHIGAIRWREKHTENI